MTKKFEEYTSGRLGGIVEKMKGRTILGEVTVVLKP
jgi:16S rRNA C1402 (ribose-2'-O) methylase RsmI